MSHPSLKHLPSEDKLIIEHEIGQIKFELTSLGLESLNESNSVAMQI